IVNRPTRRARRMDRVVNLRIVIAQGVPLWVIRSDPDGITNTVNIHAGFIKATAIGVLLESKAGIHLDSRVNVDLGTVPSVHLNRTVMTFDYHGAGWLQRQSLIDGS